MAETASTQQELRKDDAERLDRLTEEVQGRLEEMALIATRTLGIKLENDFVTKFVARTAREASDDAGEVIYIEILDPPEGGSICVIHCPDGVSHIERPCGSGPLPC
jgi:hypothetical protein